MPHNYTISIDEIVDYLGLERDPRHRSGATSYNVKCPFCNDKKYHMNINREKNAYNCVRCTGNKTGGGALDLFSRVALGVEHVPGSKENGGNGSYIFKELSAALKLDSPVQSKAKKVRIEKKAAEKTLRAEDEKLNEVYSLLLRFKHFKLSKKHKENLLKRGLDEEAIVKNKYRSIESSYKWIDKYPKLIAIYEENNLDEERKKYPSIEKFSKNKCLAGFILANEILSEGAKLDGVPGFFKIKNYWFFKIETGMIIPTRNFKGEVIGLQARKDTGSLRYMTISSKDLPSGVTEGISRIHFPLSNKEIGPNTQVLLTEGPLKADVALHLLKGDAALIAIQGVNNRGELPKVFEYLKSKGVTLMYNALDMDKITNPHVASAGQVIRKLARKYDIEMKIRMWDECYATLKYLELSVLCRFHNIPVVYKDNIFVTVGKLAEMLTKNGIEHSIKVIEGKEEKVYWSDTTKGLDDYLLSLTKN